VELFPQLKIVRFSDNNFFYCDFVIEVQICRAWDIFEVDKNCFGPTTVLPTRISGPTTVLPARITKDAGLTGDNVTMITGMTEGMITPQRASRMVWDQWAVWLVIGILLVIILSLIATFVAYVLLTRRARRGRRLRTNRHWIEMEEDRL
jgi:hypothetical protein